jgi:riboflavin kinase/FMN adenylyltransferase
MISETDYIVGRVVEGKKFSRQIGFPTLNIALNEACKFQYGVYAGLMEHNGQLYQGVMNIGVTPHFGINKAKLEMHVFNFNRDLYGETIKVIPTCFIRKEMKFSDIDSLVKQIANDCEVAKIANAS